MRRALERPPTGPPQPSVTRGLSLDQPVSCAVTTSWRDKNRRGGTDTLCQTVAGENGPVPLSSSLLGSAFLLAYADGLLHHGYAQAPLERMAYELEELFKRGLPLDVETQVRDETLCLARNPGLTGRPRRA